MASLGQTNKCGGVMNYKEHFKKRNIEKDKREKRKGVKYGKL